MITSGKFLDPTDLMDDLLCELQNRIGWWDGCVECGYAFTYSLEGCDACKPITDLLVAGGWATKEDH